MREKEIHAKKRGVDRYRKRRWAPEVEKERGERKKERDKRKESKNSECWERRLLLARERDSELRSADEVSNPDARSDERERGVESEKITRRWKEKEGERREETTLHPNREEGKRKEKRRDSHHLSKEKSWPTGSRNVVVVVVVQRRLFLSLSLSTSLIPRSLTSRSSLTRDGVGRSFLVENNGIQGKMRRSLFVLRVIKKRKRSRNDRQKRRERKASK